MGDKVFSSEEVMIAIGRSPNVEGLNLEAAGVKYDKRKGISIDSTMRTNVKHIYACGDVAGPYPFTHMAEYQAGLVITNALLRRSRACKGWAHRRRGKAKIRRK
jgi:pyruvate/2-oxoglutarate dehydrogenase complex dihydrolipoamide dehydrogenase (E3) component